MCNLYRMSPKTDLEVYIRRHLAKVWLPDDLAKPFVGPFDPGLFLRVDVDGELVGEVGQWGLIRPGAPARKDMIQPKTIAGKKPSAARPRSTNNARSETVATTPTFRAAWAEGRRCLIPASWYQEPNWETGRNVWWQLKRADGQPWMLAGIWNHWTDPETGEIVPSYTMLTCNCDGHPLLGRLHKPDPKLPPDQQDKRAVVHLEPAAWSIWLSGSVDQARDLIHPAPAEFFDRADAIATDELLVAAK
ncbi:SOS response-associated peptidase family protein [Mitsuaria sp. CC2]|uniref:SOS response-associated peptidase n=1 Tax=Mitsuaria sp. CC2 TaxID=3029186 RepID=UPI003B8E702F